jgi:hypothetical protein
MVASQFAATSIRQPDRWAADFVAFVDGLVDQGGYHCCQSRQARQALSGISILR